MFNSKIAIFSKCSLIPIAMISKALNANGPGIPVSGKVDSDFLHEQLKSLTIGDGQSLSGPVCPMIQNHLG